MYAKNRGRGANTNRRYCNRKPMKYNNINNNYLF